MLLKFLLRPTLFFLCVLTLVCVRLFRGVAVGFQRWRTPQPGERICPFFFLHGFFFVWNRFPFRPWLRAFKVAQEFGTVLRVTSFPGPRAPLLRFSPRAPGCCRGLDLSHPMKEVRGLGRHLFKSDRFRLFPVTARQASFPLLPPLDASGDVRSLSELERFR